MASDNDVATGSKSSVVQVLMAYLNTQVQVLQDQIPGVCQGVPNAVHLMRIATRRLRSVMITYRIFLDLDRIHHLREELQWLGLILGAERDAEVMRQRLTNLIAQQPADIDFKSVQRIDEQLELEFRDAHLVVLRVMTDERFLRLLQDLYTLISAPPLTHLARKSAKKIVPGLLRSESKRLRKFARASEKISVARDKALHDVRKSAKRMRYAAETAALVPCRHAGKLSDAAEEIQTILGEHHDAVVARDLFQRLCEQAHSRGEDDVNLARLAAIEERNAQRSELQFRTAWKFFPTFLLKG
jgi:CHAD domain-containing protein